MDTQSDSEIILTSADNISAQWSDLELIHQHGAQSLYRVKQYGRWYILKTADPSNTNALERLRKEFTIGVSLEHPHIVRTLDYGHNDQVGDYIRMEWIDGMTLSKWLKSNPSHDLRQRIVTQLVDAVAYLHAHQIVHRDLKPDNIMVTRNGNNLKLIDFGLSDSDDYSVFKQPAGTLSYIAPEQLSGAKVDVRADIYSLGKIIAFILPASYRHIVRICTNQNKDRRYPSMQALSQAIDHVNQLRKRWLLYVSVAFLVVTWISIAIYMLQPDPRGQVIAQAHKLVEQEYDRLIRLSHPTTIPEWNENTLDFYTRCAYLRDSVAQTIEDEVLRADFINAMVLESGRKAQEYQQPFLSLPSQKD